MTAPLPETPRPEVGQRPEPAPMSPEVAEATARDLFQRALHEEPTPTSYRDDSPLPAVGSTPPVAQPGRPAMSQGATDASVLMLAGGGAVSMVSLSAGLLMYLSQYADPVVCGVVVGAPTALVLAVARLVRRAGEATPDEHHHHYEGPVVHEHREVTNNNRWWGKSTTDN